MAPKPRSCVVCRNRKVRCDKQSPCSNCRLANIPCVTPSDDRPPRWARRLERITNNAAASKATSPQDADPGVGKVMDRLRTLENLVKELSGQLANARATTSSSTDGSSRISTPQRSLQDRDADYQKTPSPAPSSSSLQKQLGRLVLEDASHSHYVSSGFWSRVNDELDGLKMDTRALAGEGSDSSDDEDSPPKSLSSPEPQRTPSERHAFLFRHNLSASNQDLRELHPLPSQVPFLLNVFSENVNFLMQIVHMPTVTKMVRDPRGGHTRLLTPANEALVFSIYYAAVISMEEDDVMINFGSSKVDLNLKYRVGLEHALAKADFLNAPNIVLVQAFTIFLFLVRRHDSPRFVWMMTGLVIRMALYLGLQRDGAQFEHLSPFEIEMRRKVWWAICMLDVRASEDQGTDLTITSGSFDTKVPLNINDADISPESKEMPRERDGVTDMTFPRISVGSTAIVMQMMAPGVRDGAAGLEGQSRWLDQIYQTYEREYFRYTTESGNILYWVGVIIARLVMAKMTLIHFLPVLFSPQSKHFSDDIRTKLLISAIEVAEYNHALNDEQACRQWRWVYQVYSHWYAVIYILIDVSRRPWSSTVERAWVALHSSWLIPAKTPMTKDSRMWSQLRQLMAKARKHRDAELNRLRADPQTAARLDVEDQKTPLPSSSGLLPAGTSVEVFRGRWRKLVSLPDVPKDDRQTTAVSGLRAADPLINTTITSEPTAWSLPSYDTDGFHPDMTFKPMFSGMNGQQAGESYESTHIRDSDSAITHNGLSDVASGQIVGMSYDQSPKAPVDLADGRSMGSGFAPWLWADADPSVNVFSDLDVDYTDVNMGLDTEIDWYDWIETAKGMEWDTKI